MCESIPIPGEFGDANDFWQHPIHNNYEANRLGIIRHLKNKKDIGSLNKCGYLRITLKNEGKKIHYQKHRFIYECFFGLITDMTLVVDHINNIKTDNNLDNLQLISQSQNKIKEHRKGKKIPPISLKATNIETDLSSDYYSISECSRKLDICAASISRVLNGITKSATSKKDKCKYIFEKIETIPYKQKGEKRLPIRVRAIRIDTHETTEYYTDETSDYDSINKCCKYLDVNRTSVRKILNGECKSAMSKKYNCLYTFIKI